MTWRRTWFSKVNVSARAIEPLLRALDGDEQSIGITAQVSVTPPRISVQAIERDRNEVIFECAASFATCSSW
jgi:hypothetical protein